MLDIVVQKYSESGKLSSGSKGFKIIYSFNLIESLDTQSGLVFDWVTMSISFNLRTQTDSIGFGGLKISLFSQNFSSSMFYNS